ncbi:chemotaxis protein CheA [Desulfuromonas sp. AOP6]|nr:chemotaxis protein CheA [Desulfuromonas sp. AOP6]BCA80676.1 chemotaxis protein CheA [Desulfuromonas sp. AOP6]
MANNDIGAMMESQRAAFREEAGELLAELEESLLELEERPEDMDVVGRVFRAMHTIKGSGAMFGFEAIASFTHEVETVFDLVRTGQLPVTRDLVDLSLAARDQIKRLLDAADPAAADESPEGARLIGAFRAMQPRQKATASSPKGAEKAADKKADAEAAVYRIRFKPFPQLLRGGTNPVCLLNELRDLGPCEIVAQPSDIPFLDELDPEECHVHWDVVLTTEAGLDAIRDVFIFVEDEAEIRINRIDDGLDLAEGQTRRLGEILVERGDISQSQLQELLGQQQKIGEKLIASRLVEPGQVTAALAEQNQVRQLQEKRKQEEAQSSLRVPAEKLDAMVDLVGELVTVQSRLSQVAAQRNDSDLLAIAEEVERLTAELRDNTLNIRMLPIGTTFSKFKRLVRDLSRELGKEIDLQTSGGDTELDKTVIEKLGDPLVHLIRNSIDHGIESPEKRQAAGKPRLGTIHLSAEHSGDSVIIRIQDDGGGLNREAIRQKAVERGLISEGEVLADHDLYQLIFAAGFSTATSVTSVSGRGVGMDVVKRAIEALRGSLEIDSQPGVGALISIRIPLTLAIIESLLVRLGDSHFVLPLDAIEECIELTAETRGQAKGRSLVNVRGQLIPYIDLRRQFAVDGERPTVEQVVITRVNHQQIGFVVDHVIGEHQTVIKSLGRFYRGIEGVSGATILGDGSVALILDIASLLKAVEQEKQLENRK